MPKKAKQRLLKPLREAAIFGLFGGPVNVTDGRHVLMWPTQNEAIPQFQYTLMPTHMWHPFGVHELQSIEISHAFGFSKGCMMMKIPSHQPRLNAPDASKTSWYWPETGQKALYDLEQDPAQQKPLENADVERRLVGEIRRLMRECQAPAEQFARLGLGEP